MFYFNRTHLPYLLYILITLSACSSDGGGGSTKDLHVNTNSISFTAAQNGNSSLSQNFLITWSRPDVAGVAIGYPPNSTLPSWLDISATGNASPVTMTISVDPGSLGVGRYETTLRIVSGTVNLDIIDIIDIPLTLTIVAEVTALPSNVGIEMNVGEMPAEIETVNLMQSGVVIAPSNVSNTVSADWLSASINNNDIQIATTSSALALAEGAYQTNVTISHDYGNLVVPVTLNVYQKSVNFVSPYIATAGVSGDVIIRGHGFSSLSNPSVLFGSTPALSLEVISDSEIHANYPALTASSHNVIVQDMTITLPSSANLVVTDAPAYSYAAIARTGSVNKAIYDAERQAIYISDATENELERYTFNGTGWDFSALNYTSSDGAAVAITPDGKKLYKLNFVTITEIDLDTFTIINEFWPYNAGPSLGWIVFSNDGKALISSSSEYNLFTYDILSGALYTLSTDFSYANRYIMASADGSKVFMPSRNITTIQELATYYDATTGQLITSTTLTSHIFDMSVDKTGNRIILADNLNDQAYVYDQNYNQLGILPPLEGLDLFFTHTSLVISPDGTRAYVYVGTTGLLHVLDLTITDGGNGFVEIGTGISLQDPLPTNSVTKMSISPDGGTLFIVSNGQLIIQPVP